MIDFDRGEKACPLDTKPDAKFLQLIAHAEVEATNVAQILQCVPFALKLRS